MYNIPHTTEVDDIYIVFVFFFW